MTESSGTSSSARPALHRVGRAPSVRHGPTFAGGSTRAAIFTDCNILRAGFEVFTDGAEFEIVGFAGNKAEMIELVQSEHPDVVIVPTVDGAIDVCRAITRRYSAIPVLIVAASLDDVSVREAIEAGARGLIFKDVEPADFRSALKRLVAGESVLDTRVTGRVIAWAAHQAVAGATDGLSPREWDVLRQVVKGEPNKRIARLLGLSENTVKTYLRRAYRKLGCSTRTEAATIIASRGLL